LAGAEAVIDLDIGQINIRDGDDEVALQYLGAAVVITWARLPPEVREMLLGRSISITGLLATPGLETKIGSLLRRHAKSVG
jgi:hypothetical protein